MLPTHITLAGLPKVFGMIEAGAKAQVRRDALPNQRFTASANIALPDCPEVGRSAVAIPEFFITHSFSTSGRAAPSSGSEKKRAAAAPVLTVSGGGLGDAVYAIRHR